MRVWKDTIFTAVFIAAFLVVVSTLLGSSARADCPNPSVEELRIQMGLSSAELPGRLPKPKAPPTFGCERPFVYRGEVYSVDAPQAQDASTLRSFIKDVPSADSLLESYQKRRERSRISAYTGTVGLFMLLIANSVIPNMKFESRDSVRSTLQITGLALTIGGFTYSFSLLRTNERLIPQAVKAYNDAKPKDPVELKFETGWSF
jgi:hypothetical protein